MKYGKQKKLYYRDCVVVVAICLETIHHIGSGFVAHSRCFYSIGAKSLRSINSCCGGSLPIYHGSVNVCLCLHRSLWAKLWRDVVTMETWHPSTAWSLGLSLPHVPRCRSGCLEARGGGWLSWWEGSEPLTRCRPRCQSRCTAEPSALWFLAVLTLSLCSTEEVLPFVW